MGIIKAVLSAAGGALADQWLEAIEPNDMGRTYCFYPRHYGSSQR